MSVRELAECVGRLRYVGEGDEVRAEDYNMKVDCIRMVRSALAELDPLNPSVEELRKIVERLGHVKAGDIIEPEHHNLVVDALKVVSKILEARLLPALGLTVAYEASPVLGVPEPPSIPEAAPLYGVNLVALELTAASIFMEVSVYYLTTYKQTSGVRT